ncbi:4-alpha-glucanotransferase [Candidatus Woesearchaeota archaeon CG10_big_fil_rev_8_21_14_0_10_37_12]|nr:MAG: 4-alpha-glucanotransferase [Candidatus Woesearchaeota archaeon CG10_big_fil_rev_8_21_14_0_10_37_12]
MNVLMFGWEFPPNNSGGLGTACQGLTKALSKQNTNIIFVLPKEKPPNTEHCIFVSTNTNVNVRYLDSPLLPYITSKGYEKLRKQNTSYGTTLFEEVHRYAELAKQIAENNKYEVIHAHDWLTYLAGINAKKVSNKPLIVHVHATEYDRTGGNGINEQVYEIEKQGMEEADKVIAVSEYTKNIVVSKYGIVSDKIVVVHNGTEMEQHQINKTTEKLVLSLGRLTLQKGVDYFIYAAKRVLDLRNDVTFIVAGSGDMEHALIEKAAELGIAHKVLFAGFLRGQQITEMYSRASVYVMPSVSEPFGIVALEAIKHHTPVIISKQSGVSELLNHCLTVDFWDVDELANKIVAVLDYSVLAEELRKNSVEESKQYTWEPAAKKCLALYQEVRSW